MSSSLSNFSIFNPANSPSRVPLPLFTGKVAAGFPSPADDYVEKNLDLNELLVQKPAAMRSLTTKVPFILLTFEESTDIGV
jgi:hypothetical protein